MEELRDGWRSVINEKKSVTKGAQFNNRSELKPLNLMG